MIKVCPKCKHVLTKKAKVDSDDRIFEAWFWCSNCDWNSKKENINVK